MRNKTYYHASPTRYRMGKVLCDVFMTNSPVPHFTIIRCAEYEGWHIYEVEPEGEVISGWWDDLRTSRAKVVRYVGTARGIASNALKHWKKKESLGARGSIVRKAWRKPRWALR